MPSAMPLLVSQYFMYLRGLSVRLSCGTLTWCTAQCNCRRSIYYTATGPGTGLIFYLGGLHCDCDRDLLKRDGKIFIDNYFWTLFSVKGMAACELHSCTTVTVVYKYLQTLTKVNGYNYLRPKKHNHRKITISVK